MKRSRNEIQGAYSVPGARIEGAAYQGSTRLAGFVGGSTSEKGYSLLFFHTNAKWRIGLLVTFLVISIAGAFYFWYIRHTNDAAPDSIVGFAYAIVGTTFLLLAAITYSIRRRSRNKRALGQLNSALNWHIFFAIIGLALLFMHSFGNFNPRTGTYALYALIALVASGFIGRALDHFIPYLITREVQRALTIQGEDRIETISQQLQAIVAHNAEFLHSHDVEAQFITDSPSQRQDAMNGAHAESFDFEERSLHTPWDLAYISLEATPQELSRAVGQQRFMPDKQSALTRPGALVPGVQEQISALREVQHAMQRQQYYRYIIRYWRVFHIWLALLTIGLTTWHIIYALQLLLH